MSGNLSELDIEGLSTFVPSWFLKEAINGADSLVLTKKIEENLAEAYVIAGEPLPEALVLQEKADDLYEVYKDIIEEFISKDS